MGIITKEKRTPNNVYMAIAARQYYPIQHLGYDSIFQYY